ncbi:MAG TPA: copper chaperone PCu(A)C [Rhizomicrobium sp.]
MRLLNSNALHIAAMAALALVVTMAAAEGAEVKISDAWVRALPSGLPAAGYFTLHNDANRPLTLTSAQSSACGMLMLHKSDNMGGMMHMEDVTKVEVPAGGTISFAPGGYHLMCMQPSTDIKPGAKVKIALGFSDGSSIAAPFEVRSASGR